MTPEADNTPAKFDKGKSSARRPNDAIVREILSGMYDGRYAPGQRLVEADLTRQFGVSRGSIREALQRLAAEGVVQLTAHKGAFIRRLSRRDIRGVLQVLELLHGLASRLAAENIDSPGAREALSTSFERLIAYRHAGDYLDFVRARNAFYRTAMQIAGNAELSRVLPTTHVHLARVMFRLHTNPAEVTRFEEYTEMFDAIMSGDPDRAERAGRAHQQKMLASVDALPETAFQAPD